MTCDDDRRRAAEWGLAATITGGVMFLAAPITLLLAVAIWETADRSPVSVQINAWLARSAVVVGLGTAAAGVWFGVKANRIGDVWRRPSALALAGLLLSSASLLMWIATAIGLLRTTESMLHFHG